MGNWKTHYMRLEAQRFISGQGSFDKIFLDLWSLSPNFVWQTNTGTPCISIYLSPYRPSVSFAQTVLYVWCLGNCLRGWQGDCIRACPIVLVICPVRCISGWWTYDIRLTLKVLCQRTEKKSFCGYYVVFKGLINVLFNFLFIFIVMSLFYCIKISAFPIPEFRIARRHVLESALLLWHCLQCRSNIFFEYFFYLKTFDFLFYCDYSRSKLRKTTPSR